MRTGGDEDDNEDDDDEDDRDHMANGAATTGHWSEPFVPIIHSVVQQTVPAIMAWAARPPAGSAGGRGASRNGSGSDDRTPPWEARDFVDARSAHQKQAAYREKQASEKQAADEQAARQAADSAHAAKLKAAIAVASSPGPRINVLTLMQMLPQRTVTKFMQLQAALSPDERSDAMQIFQGYGAEGLEELLPVFDASSLEESTDFLRRLITDWRARQAAKQVAPVEPPPNSGSTSGTSGNGSPEPR